jgi:two-component system, LytTR family, response regulator
MPAHLKVFIVDDEFQSRNFLSKCITTNHHDIQVVGSAANVEEAIAGIRELQPDLVFLDVMLNNETGFDVLERIGDIQFELVFTTAHDEYAIKAFRFNAIDYLLKPIDIEELDAAIEKVKSRRAETKGIPKEVVDNFLGSLKSPTTIEKKIPVPTSEGFLLVPLQEIVYCQSNSNYTQLNLTNKRKLISSYTLKHYDDLLSEHLFFRAHKSFLINLAHVTQYKKGEGGTIVMSDQMEIELSRRNKEAFIRIFKA